MKGIRLTMTGILLGALLTAATPAFAARWSVAPADAEVVFTSKAPLETFKGRTALLAGWVEFDAENLSMPLAGEIIVDLASFDTGKKKRNRHMRENHLETDRFPVARFVPEAVISPTAASLPPGAEVEGRLRGLLDLHGVARPLECPLQLRRDMSGAVFVSVFFPVLLSDHAIERPKFLVMKLADEQKVAVTFTLREEGTP